MSQWVRLWEDMPNDPKWRVVARRSRRPVAEVLAVFVHMMTNAAGSAKRGELVGWSDEDVAIAIDAETEHVTAIREAMGGKVLNGDELTGWSKRQPAREDGSAERAREWRERQKQERGRAATQANGVEHTQTQANAPERPEEKREDKNTSSLRSDVARADVPLLIETEQPERLKPRRKHLYPPDAFNRWYGPYPNKVGRGAAEKAFRRIQAADNVPFDALVVGLERYRRTKPADREWCNPATWLNEARWADEPAGPNGAAMASAFRSSEPVVDFGHGVRWPETSIRRKIDQWRNEPSSWPAETLGPAPGQPGCRVPEHLLARAA